MLCGENQSAYERDKGFALDCAHRRGGGGGAAIRVAVEQLPVGGGEPADEGERGVPRRFAGRDVPPDVGLQGAEVRQERLFFGAKVRGRYSGFHISEYAKPMADVEHPYRDAGLYLHGNTLGRIAPCARLDLCPSARFGRHPRRGSFMHR